MKTFFDGWPGRRLAFSLGFGGGDGLERDSICEFVCCDLVAESPTSFLVTGDRIDRSVTTYGPTNKSDRTHSRASQRIVGRMTIRIRTDKRPTSYRELIDFRSSVEFVKEVK